MAMICASCFGMGLVWATEYFERENGLLGHVCYDHRPCPDCLGGYQHCCEGERAQPEPDHAALSAEFMGRFPVIRKRLAE